MSSSHVIAGLRSQYQRITGINEAQAKRIKELEAKLARAEREKENITVLCAEGVEFMTRTELAAAILAEYDKGEG